MAFSASSHSYFSVHSFSLLYKNRKAVAALDAHKPKYCAAGEDLLVASADKPFRFPATFTFVVRSFTVLDGIGKGLDPRFDISEIAAPYARGLLLEGNPQYTALAKDFKRRVGLQVRFVIAYRQNGTSSPVVILS